METKLIEILLAPEVIALSAAIVALLYGIGRIPVGRKTLGTHPRWRRFLPLLPLVLGVAGAVITAKADDGEDLPLHHPVLIGLWAGFVAAHGHKVFTRLVAKKLSAKEGD